jgi:hypothetical protein
MIALDRTGLEDAVLGTEIDRKLPSTAVNRWCAESQSFGENATKLVLAWLETLERKG